MQLDLFWISKHLIIKKKKKQTIEHKGKTYILEQDEVYKMDENGKKGTQYGILVDGIVKKLKSNDVSI